MVALGRAPIGLAQPAIQFHRYRDIQQGTSVRYFTSA